MERINHIDPDGKTDFIYDELNQQIEVRGVVANCAAAGQGTGSFDSTANAGEGGTPINLLCYGKGPLVEKNLYGPDGMRAIREVYAPVTNLPKRTTYARLGGNVVKEYTEEYRAITSTTPEISHDKAYIYGPLGLLATEELCTFNCKSDETAGLNVTRYYELDHLGTIRAISDSLGHLVSTSDYEPFGLELKSADAAFPWWADASSNTHKFTGHERDDETSEDYMKARMYVLSTARFPQIDPQFGGAGDPQNWNPYIYVLNSPVGASDPTGMMPILCQECEKSVPDMTRVLGAGEGTTGIALLSPLTSTHGPNGAQLVNYLLNLGFSMTQIINYGQFRIDATISRTTTTVVGAGGAGGKAGGSGSSLETSSQVQQTGTLSGQSWINEFPNSTSISDLEDVFQKKVENFISALRNAGISVTVNSTLRPPERAYLMHYAYEIARKGLDPTTVPARAGININWVHRNADGTTNLSASRAAAEAMVVGYGIVYEPALTSRHTEGKAIDMNISWSGNPSIRNTLGQLVNINSNPRSGLNAQIIHIGAEYGVIKLVSDPPHWSTDGH